MKKIENHAKRQRKKDEKKKQNKKGKSKWTNMK